MVKRDDTLSWLLGISIGIITVLAFFNLDQLTVVLIGGAVAFISAIICWKMAKTVHGNVIIAYFLGFILGIIGVLVYLIYFLGKRSGIKNKKETKK